MSEQRCVERIMKWLVAVAVTLCAAATHVAIGAGYASGAGDDHVKMAWADVLRVDPVYRYEQSTHPYDVCDDAPAEYQPDSGNRAAGTVLGAVVGGVLGSTVGKGDGRRAATVAGAVAGGAIGNSVARGEGPAYGESQRRCHPVANGPPDRRIAAYDVQYRYRGEVFMSRLDYDPGDRLRVRVIVEPAE